MRVRVDRIPPYPGEDKEINPGLYGKRLAEYIAASLTQKGYKVKRLAPEDWGWAVILENSGFSLWIGCGSYTGMVNGFLCFIEPSKPIRGLLRNLDTRPTVDRLADVLEEAIQESGKVSSFRWWTSDEVGT